MPLFVLFGIIFCSYVHHIPDEHVDDNKKVVCTTAVVALLIIWVVLSAVFGGKPASN